MYNELVSIIVPVYNVEKYLVECLNSIINQTYKNLQIILVVDDSTDNSTLICKEYQNLDDRIEIIYRSHTGLSLARNYGLELAEGQYVYFCDSDDYIEPNLVESLVDILHSDNSECVFFNAIAFSDEGSYFKHNKYERKGEYSLNSGAYNAYLQMIRDEYKPCAYLIFYRKSFLDDNNLSFYNGILGEDELFSFYTYMLATRMSYSNRVLYHRRMRAGSLMTSNGNEEKKFLSYLIVYNIIREFVVDDSESEKKNAYNEFISRIGKSLLLAYRNLDTNMKRLHKQKYEELKSDIIHNRGFHDPSLYLRLYSWNAGVLVSGIRKMFRKYMYGKV